MANNELGIIRRKDIATQLTTVRNELIRHLDKHGYTNDEIAAVIRLSKAGVSRVIRFGSNSNLTTKNNESDIIKK